MRVAHLHHGCRCLQLKSILAGLVALHERPANERPFEADSPSAKGWIRHEIVNRGGPNGGAFEPGGQQHQNHARKHGETD